MSKHLNITGHELSLNDTKILAKDNYHPSLLFKEMIHIKTSENINNKQDYAKLGNFYDNIFKIAKF